MSNDCDMIYPMAGKIRVLSEDTINKIAAGEVIENSASVIKELLENSLDAGSTEVHIEIKGGGRQLIRITDNGCGMSSDDALLCLERHATSKIREVDDIESVGTLGFRGEAIPSIASISKFTLLTCPVDLNAVATMVIVEGGRILKACAAARSAGTTIEIKNLFYNVPARRKFQKNPAHDTTEVLKLVSTLALGYPSIGFDLVSEQESLLRARPLPDNSLVEQIGTRIAAVLGEEFLSQCAAVDCSLQELSLTGFVGLPQHSRPNRTAQYLFINGRAVVSPLVSFIVRDAYGTSLPTNRHPMFVLHLRVPGEIVDVNVHPQKREVRLRQNDVIKQLILEGVNKAIQGSAVFIPAPQTVVERVFTPLPEISLPWDDAPISAVVAPPVFFEPRVRDEVPESPQTMLFKPTLTAPRVLLTIRGYVLLDPNTCKHLPSISLEAIMLLVLDQRAAHNRILFERLRFEKPEKTPSQPLLIPETLELSTLEAACLREVLPQLKAMGFDIDEFGQQTFLIRAIPAELDSSDTASALSELISQLREFQSHALPERDKRLSLIVSKLAISRKQHLSVEEAQHLVNMLFQCEMPLQCPKGNPTIAGMSEKELAKIFQTRVKDDLL